MVHRAWSAEQQAGFALAALLADDRQLNAVQSALPNVLYTRLRSLSGEATGRARADLVAQLLMAVRPPLDASTESLPVRMGALLAQRLPRPLARERLARAPKVRLGYAIIESLLPQLLRIARRHPKEPLSP